MAALLDLLQDDSLDWHGRWFVIRSLGNFDRPEVISALVSLFTTTEDGELLATIGEALAQIGPNAIVALTELLQTPRHRLVAVQVMARIHHPATVSSLLAVVHDADVMVRAIALQALADFNQPAVLPALVEALEDLSSQVRLAAVRGLVSFSHQVDPEQMVLWLLPRLGDVQLSVAQQAVYLLGRLRVESATEALLTLINGASTPLPLYIAVIQALGWQDTASALHGLIDAWAQVDSQVRLEIVRALEQFSQSDLRNLACHQIQGWLWQLSAVDTSSALRRAMVLALGKLGSPAVEGVLRSYLNDVDPAVRIHAEAALASLSQHL